MKMKEHLKLKFLLIGLVAMVSQIVPLTQVYAANLPGVVVINEVAWAGTADNSNDEWIELYNSSNVAVDLAGWQIVDDGSSTYKLTSGQIAPHGYFLIEDTEVSTSIPADAVIGLSLANAGDSLVLEDNAGAVIDTVNGSGGAWYSGDATSKATMERINPGVVQDSASNWASAKAGNGTTGRSGQPILGTPKAANSNFGGTGPEVMVEMPKNEFKHGEQFTAEVMINDAEDLYSYGFEMNYDEQVLKFISAQEGDFLKSGNVSTAFNSALENGVAGDLLVGGARLINPPKGIDGDGELFHLTFEVVGNNDDIASISFAGGSFITDSLGDVQTKFTGNELSVKDQVVAVVGNLKAQEGVNRFSILLSWEVPVSGAEKYLIKKLMPDGSYKDLGETISPQFTDTEGVANGGGIVPNLEYSYQVIAVSAGLNSNPVGVTGKDLRGVTGDIDRNDRVDGRDIEKLARSYGSGFSDEEYLLTADLNFDGEIDGIDLVELASNFGLKYSK